MPDSSKQRLGGYGRREAWREVIASVLNYRVTDYESVSRFVNATQAWGQVRYKEGIHDERERHRLPIL